MDDTNTIENKPEENPIKRDLDNTLQIYNHYKSVLWVESKKEDSPEAPTAYAIVLQCLEILLENTKADNIPYIPTIRALQERIENLLNYEGIVTPPIIQEIKDLCEIADTQILRPHLSTLHPLLNI